MKGSSDDDDDDDDDDDVLIYTEWRSYLVVAQNQGTGTKRITILAIFSIEVTNVGCPSFQVITV